MLMSIVLALFTLIYYIQFLKYLSNFRENLRKDISEFVGA